MPSITRYYAVFDETAQSYGPLIPAGNDALATRLFRNEVNRVDTTNLLYLYPDEYSLFFLFELDHDEGRVLQPQHPQFLVKGTALKN